MSAIRLSPEGDLKFFIFPELVEDLPSYGFRKSGPVQKRTACSD